MKTPYKILITWLSIVITISIGIAIHAQLHKKKPQLTLKDVYGRWQVTKTKDGEFKYAKDTKKRFMGRIIEFHPKYIIIDDKLYNDPEYTYDGVLSIADWPLSLEKEDFRNEINLDREIFRFMSWLCNHDTFIDILGHFVLNNDRLISSSIGLIVLQHLPPRPWWQRAYSYLYAVLTPSRYNPEKVLPQSMRGKWEIVAFRDRLAASGITFSDTDAIAESVKYLSGKTIILHPKYIILDSVQYNNPHYQLESWDLGQAVHLDSYNGYKFAGRKILCHSDHFHMDHYHKEFSFHLDAAILICRKLPEPDLWERTKYYCKYLLGIDASAKGYTGE